MNSVEMQPSLDSIRSHGCPSEIQRLETNLRKAQEQYSSLRTQFQQLREDFRFNLDVLAERDQELHRYELVTRGDSKSIQEHKAPPARDSESQTEASEDNHQNVNPLPGFQENNNLNLEYNQRFVEVNHEEQLKEVDKAISKLQTEMDTLSSHAMSMKTQHQQQLQDREDIIHRYKKQLSASLEREKHLEQRLVQVELEWQKKWEDLQSKHYLEHEQLIEELTSAREKVNAELMEAKAQLQELTVILQCVTKERDQALQGCMPGPGSLASEELAALQQQNYRLQAVVSEMRKQMEELSHTAPPPQHSHTENIQNKESTVSKKEDIKQLETNITKVKEKKSCMCCCGRVSSVNAVAPLRSRLKRAASCIARLNRDRQELIELCNRLRAQVGAAPSLRQNNGNTANHRVHKSIDGLKSEENRQTEPSKTVDQELLSTQNSGQNSSRQLQAHRHFEESMPSLSALWALLDQEPLQDLSEDQAEVPPEVSTGPAAGRAKMAVRGVGAPVHRKSMSKPPLKRGQLKSPGKVTQSARIRNYNIKD